MLTVGKVLKPHGVKGEVKVQSMMDSPSLLKQLKAVFVKEKKFEVASVKETGDFGVLKLVGIDTVEQAEALRNCEITVERADAPKLPDGRIYIADIIGSAVFAGEKPIGELYEVLTGGRDVYCVRDGEREVLFPVVPNLIQDIDTEKKVILLDEGLFGQVAAYQDED